MAWNSKTTQVILALMKTFQPAGAGYCKTASGLSNGHKWLQGAIFQQPTTWMVKPL
jgi:hypothetical protein